MRQIGGENSRLFALDRQEADQIVAAISDGVIAPLLYHQDEGLGGAIMHFAAQNDVTTAQMLL